MWRFRGVDPVVAMYGDGALSAWPSRHEAVLTAFAVHAAQHERAVEDIGAVLGGGG